MHKAILTVTFFLTTFLDHAVASGEEGLELCVMKVTCCGEVRLGGVNICELKQRNSDVLRIACRKPSHPFP